MAYKGQQAIAVRRRSDGRFFVRTRRGNRRQTAWCLAGATLFQVDEFAIHDVEELVYKLGGPLEWEWVYVAVDGE
jgi:hypothetical protein